MVILPIAAFVIILSIGITKELAVGIMILASCPGGVTSNIITKLAKGDTALSISYTAVISLLTIITLPIVTILSMKHFMGAVSSLTKSPIIGLDYVSYYGYSSWFRGISS